MNDLKKIESTISQMCSLLKMAKLDDWEQSLSSIGANFSADPEGSANSILKMYGGMGSLNDIVLYRNGQPLIQENKDFSLLRVNLYELCRAI